MCIVMGHCKLLPCTQLSSLQLWETKKCDGAASSCIQVQGSLAAGSSRPGPALVWEWVAAGPTGKPEGGSVEVQGSATAQEVAGEPSCQKQAPREVAGAQSVLACLPEGGSASPDGARSSCQVPAERGDGHVANLGRKHLLISGCVVLSAAGGPAGHTQDMQH